MNEQLNDGKFISELPVTTIDGSELIPCEKNEQEYHVSINDIKKFAVGNIDTILDKINGEVI